jgi:mono/diheme cytochrome c family protein
MTAMRRRCALALGLGVLVLPGLGVTRASAQQPERRAWTAPSSADARVNPLATRPDTEPGGAKVFANRCAQCHRDDGTGTSFGPSLTGRRAQSQSDGALFWKITSGNTRTGMPSFSGLPELQRWQLVLHLRALGSSHRAPTSSR